MYTSWQRIGEDCFIAQDRVLEKGRLRSEVRMIAEGLVGGGYDWEVWQVGGNTQLGYGTSDSAEAAMRAAERYVLEWRRRAEPGRWRRLLALQARQFVSLLHDRRGQAAIIAAL